VLLDIGMPGLNGLDAARRLRQRPWGKNVLLIALTGLGQEQDRLRSEEAGFDAHLVKPVDGSVLDTLLSSWRYPD
jgi:CheY-like chemotaxis protein